MTVYRLKAVAGHGWIENVDARGPCITAIRSDVKTWPDLEAAERALARANRPGKVKNEIVAAPS